MIKSRMLSMAAAAAVMVLLQTTLTALNSPAAVAQVSPIYYDYPQNHLAWFTIESDHFLVHYQEGSERAAAVVSLIAEEVHGPVTELYEHEPDSKVSIVLKDREDYSNGAAYFFDNKIDIWLPALDSPLRGTHDWLRNVITHEYTHIVQIQSMMTRRRRVPAVYLQWLAYEEVRRPDVLYGFPRGLVTFPLASVGVPAWFAEGTAQYQRQGLGYDRWDAHRDMILRTRLLDGSTLGFEEMGTFTSKSSIERETVYNQGYAFSLYLAERFGEKVLARISHAAADSGVTDFSKVIAKATGIEGTQVFDDFRTQTLEQLRNAMQGIAFSRVASFDDLGFLNLHPVPSPDGRSIAWISNGGRDYARTELVMAELAGGEPGSGDEDAGMEEFQAAERSKASRIRLVDVHERGWLSAADQHAMDHALLRNPVVDYASGAFSFSPDSRRIVYSKARRPNPRGELYRDLWVRDLSTDEDLRLSRDGRLSDPAWHPSDPVVAAVRQEAGTQNIVLLRVEEEAGGGGGGGDGGGGDGAAGDDGAAGSVRSLTAFRAGEAVFAPRWSADGRHLFAATTTLRHGRKIIRIDRESGDLVTLMEAEGVDYRDPWPTSDGRWLYFASDQEGWYGIYRVRLDENRPVGESELVVRVQGGAFMPAVTGDRLFFAEYRADGYKLSEVDLSAPSMSSGGRDAGGDGGGDEDGDGGSGGGSFGRAESAETGSNLGITPSWGLPKAAATPEIAALSRPDDRDVQPVKTDGGHAATAVGADRGAPAVPGYDGGAVARPYSETTTGFSVFPMMRLDAYTQLNGGYGSLIRNGDVKGLGGNLWRDAKIGAYVASRDVIDRMSFFAGLSIAPGSRPAEDVGGFFAPSRLLELDRDLYMSLEYRGLPFIKRRWSPTLAAELTNLKRNVRDGLRIEEFPCTSCLPDTTSADIRYTVWEANLAMRSKVSRFLLLEAALAFSPYRVNSDGFYSRELRMFIPESSSEYFRGTSLSTAAYIELIAPTRHSDIAPNGLKGIVRYRYQPGKLLDRYEIEDGMLSAKFNSTRNHSLEMKGIWGSDLPPAWPGSWSATVTARAFGYLNSPRETFYLDYVGGFLGMRSYPFFALGGNRTAFVQTALLTPLVTDIHRQVGPFTLDKVFLKLFYEAGNAWQSPYLTGANLKHGLGAELRTAVNGYYLFPFKFFVSGTYGLNRFTIRLPDDYITPGSSGRVDYGRDLLLYFGFTFDFDPL